MGHSADLALVRELEGVFGPLEDPRTHLPDQEKAPVDLFSISQEAFSWAHEDRKEMNAHLETSKTSLVELQSARLPAQQRKRMTLEIVAKMLSYLRLEFNSEFQIPSFDEPSKLMTYRARACDLGCGNLLYIFLPVDQSQPPILSFRGTVTDDPGTLWSSLGPRGLWGILKGYFVDVGANIVEENLGKIQSVLEDLQREGYREKVIMTGHSLGGALAQRFMVEVHDRVQYVAAYNSPTVNFDVTKKWEKLLESGVVEDDQVEVYNVRGDALADHDCFLDRYFIGKKVVLIPTEHHDLSSLAAHSVCATSMAGRLLEETRSKSGESWFVWGLTRIPMLIVCVLVSIVSLVYFSAVELGGKLGVCKTYMQDRKERSVAQRMVSTFIETRELSHNILTRIEYHHRYWWDRDEELRKEMKAISDAKAFKAITEAAMGFLGMDLEEDEGLPAAVLGGG